MIIVTDQQLQAFGELIFYHKIIALLAHIEPTLSTDDELEIKRNMDRLIKKAQTYGLNTERQIAVFVFATWSLGIDFEQKFEIVNKTLSNPGISPDEKSAWLTRWVKAIFSALENE